MAYFFRSYSCDSGGKSEPHIFEVMLKDDEAPSFCPKCGCSVGDVEAIPGTHAIGGSDIAKGVDLTWKLLQESGEARAEITGNPNLKITDMKDRLREGDVAAVMPNNSVTQFMSQAEQRGVSYGWGGGSIGAPAFSSTPTPVQVDPATGYTGPGHAALAGIQGVSGQNHSGSRAQQIAAGQINKTKAG